MAEPQALEARARAFAARLAPLAGADVQSVLYSPYPFSGGQLLIACPEQVRYLHEVMALGHRAQPPEIPVHWLRVSELGHLSRPQLLDWSRYPAWSYWLRFKGAVLWGDDLRGRIPLPEQPRCILEGVLTGSLTWDRNHIFLELLARSEYARLLQSLDNLARRLMATALLLVGQWEIEEETIFARFSAAFRAQGAEELCSTLSAMLNPVTEATEERALEATWLVERLYHLLRRLVEGA